MIKTSTRYARGTAQSALELRNKAIEQSNQNNFTGARGYYEQSLQIELHLNPGGLGVAKCHECIGLTYEEQGNLPEALNHFTTTLRIRERLIPDSLELASVLGSVGGIYKSQGKLSDALPYLERVLCIKERLAPGSHSLGVIYVQIGNLYAELEKPFDALRCYEQSLRIDERLAPDSLDMASTCNNMGLVYVIQGDFRTALTYLQKALTIKEYLAPGSLTVASTYDCLGTCYKDQGKLPDAISYYNKALRIQERLAPETPTASIIYHNAGLAYKAQGDVSRALSLFKKSFQIKSRNLIPTHPDLITLSNEIADTALQLGQYADALTHVSICLQKDRLFKYAHDTHGRILAQQGQLHEAVAAFNRALLCDAGYADAALHKAEALAALAKQTGDFSAANEAISQAHAMQKTDYDAAKKAAYEHSAKDANQSMVVKLPQQQFEAGDSRLNARLDSLTAGLSALTTDVRVVQQDMSAVKERVGTLESRVDILHQKVYGLQHSMDIILLANADIQQRMNEVASSRDFAPAVRDELMKGLLSERRKMKERETQIKRFNKHPDLADFYHALLSELSAAFIAAKVIGSGHVAMEGTNVFSQASNAAGLLVNIIPVIGPLTASLLGGAATVADAVSNVRTKNEFLRIRDVADTVDDFDKIAMRLAVQLTLAKEARVSALNQALVPRNWKTHLTSIPDGLEGFIASFLADNHTQAKLWGRAEAQAIIVHLQQPHVAENYRYEDEQGDYTRPSVVANSIFAIQHPATAPARVAAPLKAVPSASISPPGSLPAAKAQLTPHAIAAPLNLDALIQQCTAFSSKKRASMDAVAELVRGLNQRAAGQITSDVVLDYVTKQLNQPNNPAFQRSTFGFSIGKCTAESLFKECRKVMMADIELAHQSVPTQAFSGMRMSAR